MRSLSLDFANLLEDGTWLTVAELLRLPAASSFRAELERWLNAYRRDLRAGGDPDPVAMRARFDQMQRVLDVATEVLGPIVSPRTSSDAEVGSVLTLSLEPGFDLQGFLSGLLYLRDHNRGLSRAAVSPGGPKSKDFRKKFLLLVDRSFSGLSPRPTDKTRATVARLLMEAAGDNQLMLKLAGQVADSLGQAALTVPWRRRPSRPRRDLVLPIGQPTTNVRPLHAERRAKHLRAIALGRLWLQQLVDGDVSDAAAIASREDRSERSVLMTISLAFVCPQIIEAAVVGRLPRGIGLTRLMDLPEDWSEQKAALGLPQQF